MTAHADISAKQRITGLSRLLGLGVAVVGLLVLFGWVADISELKSVLPGLATMKPNTAAGFVLSGICLWLIGGDGGRALTSVARWTARVLASAVGMLGLLTLGQYAFGWNLGIDQMLLHDPSSRLPGRMALMTALNFTMLAAALLLIDRQTRAGRRPSLWFAAAIAANAFVATLGYLYGVAALYQIAALSSVALHTALLFLVASLALLLARPEAELVRLFIADSAAGVIVRRLLPAAVLVPPLVGWLRWQGEHSGYYSTAFGLALYATSNVAIFSALVWWTARSVQRLQEQKLALLRISDWQHAILDSADFTVISTDTQGVIRTINSGAARALGYAPEELIGKTPVLIHDPAEVVARAAALTQQLGVPVEPGFETFVAAVRDGGSDENDWTYIRKDGSQFWVRLSVSALRDAAGKLTGFVGIGKDITAQKFAEEALRESEERMRLITDNLPALVAYIDKDERYRFANAMIGQIFGVDPVLMLGRTMREVRGEAVYASLAEQVARALRGELVTFEGQAPGKDRDYHYRSTYVPDVASGGKVRGFYAMTFDITDLKESQARFAANEERLRLITDNLPVAITHIDAQRRFTFNNETHAKWLGRPISELKGQHIADAHTPEIYDQILPHIDAAYSGQRTTFEVEGGSHHYRATYVPEFNDAGVVVGVYGLVHDITKIKKIEAELRTLAQFDVLTGLANRRRYNERLDDAIARSERTGQGMGLMFMDLDRFKQINDSLGHKVGDQVLQAFAKRLSACVRRTDTVARLAGDEFVIILEPLAAAGDAEAVALKILQVMHEPIEVDGGSVQASASIGVALRQPGETDGEALLRRADEALYAVKAEQRGKFRIAPAASVGS